MEDIEKITHPEKKEKKKSHWENLQEGWKNGTVRPPANWKKRREEWDRTHNPDGSKKEEKEIKNKELEKMPENKKDSVNSVPDDVILEKEPPKEIIKEPPQEPPKEQEKETPKETKENKVNLGKIFSNEYVLYGGIGLALVMGAIVFLKATKAKAPAVKESTPAPKPRPEYEMVDIGMGRFVKRPIKYDD